jgi:hypothetical protein
MTINLISAFAGLMTGIVATLTVFSAGYHWVYQRGRADVMREIEQKEQQDIKEQLNQLERDVRNAQHRRWR